MNFNVCEYLAPWLGLLSRVTLAPSKHRLLDDRMAYAESLTKVIRDNPDDERKKHHYYLAVNEAIAVIEAATMADYRRRRGLKEYKGRSCCAHRLIGQRTCPICYTVFGQDIKCNQPPGLDHHKVFRRTNGGLLLTSQPYDGAAASLELKLKEWTEYYGLSYRFAPEEGWHYPGHATFYEVWKDCD